MSERKRIEDVLSQETLDECAEGNCYQNAYQFVMQNPDWKLVHGRPILTGGPYKGLEFGHAWAEDATGLIVYDTEADRMLPKGIYYSVGQIHGVRSFTKDEALSVCLATRSMGPWDEWAWKRECNHCNGYGSSLKDAVGVDKCTRCGGSGLVEVGHVCNQA